MPLTCRTNICRNCSRPRLLTPRHAPAVVFEGIEVTYADLNTRANRLARYLFNRGVRTQSLVTLTMHRSVGLVVTCQPVWPCYWGQTSSLVSGSFCVVVGSMTLMRCWRVLASPWTTVIHTPR
ncbi:AMP-binding protein [Streptomyces anthocyanicus]